MKTELRRGNIVKHQDFGIVSVLTIADDYLAVQDKNAAKLNGCSWTEITPVPISKEWLYRFSFEENRGFASYRIAIDALVKWNTRTFIVVALPGEAWLELITERGANDYPELQTGILPCKYVHQLQNLYFALTGKELTTTL